MSDSIRYPKDLTVNNSKNEPILPLNLALTLVMTLAMKLALK